MITLTLPFPPSVNRLWRVGKNSQVYRSEEYRAWRRQALWQLAGRYKGDPISEPYKLTIEAKRPDQRRRDIGNLEKAISDILQDAKVVLDDRFCDWIDARWVLSGPECRIVIETIKELNNDTDKVQLGAAS